MLEVGVGTGISLDAYPPYVKVVGIDPSADMLAHAIKKTRDNGWGHIDVRQGDALNLEFPDNSFDWVTTFHVMTVVPDPLRMMQEMLRVCKPGGKIVLINHFASENPLLYSLVWIANPLTKHLGWTTRLQVPRRDRRPQDKRGAQRAHLAHVVPSRRDRDQACSLAGNL